MASKNYESKTDNRLVDHISGVSGLGYSQLGPAHERFARSAEAKAADLLCETMFCW